MLKEDNLKIILKNIVRAVQKGVNDDMRSYIEENNTETKNAVPYVRIDKINTNLKRILGDMTSVEIKMYRRISWCGILIIDHANKVIFTICTKGTLKRILKVMDRKRPHYAQTLVHILNSEETPCYEQPSLFDVDYSSASKQFDEKDYKDDFLEILKSDPSYYDKYRYWVIAYESANYTVKDIYAILMSQDYGIVDKIPLMNYLKPNFGELTLTTDQVSLKDGHSLVSIKNGFKDNLKSEPKQKIKIRAREAKKGEKA